MHIYVRILQLIYGLGFRLTWGDGAHGRRADAVVEERLGLLEVGALGLGVRVHGHHLVEQSLLSPVPAGREFRVWGVESLGAEISALWLRFEGFGPKV